MKKRVLILPDHKLPRNGARKPARKATIANTAKAFQNNEKEKRAAELVIANREMAFQNKEKEKRASELIVANKELAFQNKEKEKRAAELMAANKELAFQYKEKGKRAAELLIANKELAFQNKEKEKRAAELAIANKELEFQNDEKGKRAAELVLAIKELEAFTFISSHDLQEPLRKIQIFANHILTSDFHNLSETGKNYFVRMQAAALHMQTLINDLLAYSRITPAVRKFEDIHLSTLIAEVKAEFKDELEHRHATIESQELCVVSVIHFQFRQLLQNLVGNSLKFSRPGVPPRIVIKSQYVRGDESNREILAAGGDYCHITISDNGIGFEPEYKYKIFEIFQQLHRRGEYEGTGMGLTIAKKIVENHDGVITASSKLGHGVTIDMYIPVRG